MLLLSLVFQSCRFSPVLSERSRRGEYRLHFVSVGSISVRSVSGARRLCMAIGSTVTITSRVGDMSCSKILVRFSQLVSVLDVLRAIAMPELVLAIKPLRCHWI